MSDPKKDTGFILPEQITGWDLICVTLKIPDVPEYRAAFRGALNRLSEWHGWQRTGDTKGAQAATYWRQLLHEHLRFIDCYDLGEEIGGVARPIICKYINGDGEISFKISFNDGCTWEEIEYCDGEEGPTIDPEPPIDPIDETGDFPDPDLSAVGRCKIINITYYTHSIAQFGAFITGTFNGGDIDLLFVTSWLDAWDSTGNGLQWYPTFKAYVEKYAATMDAISASIETAMWGEVIECIVCACVPIDPSPTRDVLNCIADALEAHAETHTEESGLWWTYKALADWYRITPLAYIRERAFRDSLSTAGGTECCDCGDPEPEDCGNKTVTFDPPATAPYNLMIGVLGNGRVGQGAKSVLVPSGTFYPTPPVKEWGIRVAVPLDGNCRVSSFSWRAKFKSSPDYVAGLTIRINHQILVYNGATLAGTITGTIGAKYYIYKGDWVTGIVKFNPDAPLPVGDLVQFTWYLGTNENRTYEFTIDDIIVYVSNV